MKKKLCPMSLALGAVGSMALLLVPSLSNQILKGVNIIRGKLKMSAL